MESLKGFHFEDLHLFLFFQHSAYYFDPIENLYKMKHSYWLKLSLDFKTNSTVVLCCFYIIAIKLRFLEIMFLLSLIAFKTQANSR